MLAEIQEFDLDNPSQRPLLTRRMQGLLQEMGLDRYPELRETYFGNYTRVVWLAQAPDEELHALAEAAAARIGLPLTVVETGDHGLQRALADLVGQPA